LVCPKISAGFCEVLKTPCEKPYEYKMGIKTCPVLKQGEKKAKRAKKAKKAKAKKKKKK
jgi:hypothetical protein